MKPRKQKKEEFLESSNGEVMKMEILINKQELKQIDTIAEYLYHIGAIEEEDRSITIKYAIQHLLATTSGQSIRETLNYWIRSKNSPKHLKYGRS